MTTQTSDHVTTSSNTSPAAGLASRRGLTAGLLILRVVLGVVFIAHGAQKIFEFTLPGTVASFSGMGIPLADVTAPLVAILELVGGVLLVAGFATRLVAILLTIDMIVALFVVHLAGGFFAPAGIELVLVLGAASLAVALVGPGRLSLDAVVPATRRFA